MRAALLRVREVTDTRTAEQLERGRAIAQEQADVALETEWRTRVRRNLQRRFHDGRYHPDQL